MSAHEETIREQIEHCDRTGRNAAFAALDALVAERDRYRELTQAAQVTLELPHGATWESRYKALARALAAAATQGDEQ